MTKMNIEKLVDELLKEKKHNYKDFKVKKSILMMYDIVSYTSFCDFHETRNNHKTVYKLIKSVVEGSERIVEKLGGKPHNFTGDGYLFSFNSKSSKRAIDSALYVMELAKEFGNREDFLGSYVPNLKISLYKGRCIFGSRKDKVGVPLGRAPSKLSRIERVSRPGEILVSGSVLKSVKEFYDYEEVDGISLPGINDRGKIYRILKKY